MKAFAFGKSIKALSKQAGGARKGGRLKLPTQEEDYGTRELQTRKASELPDGYTEVEFYRTANGETKVRPLRITSAKGLDLSEYALGILYAHDQISDLQRRAGDLWAIGRARDCGSVHPRIGFYQERVPGGHDAATEPEEVTRSITDYRKAREQLKALGTMTHTEVWNTAVESRLPGWFVRQKSMIVRVSDKVYRQALHDGLAFLVDWYKVS